MAEPVSPTSSAIEDLGRALRVGRMSRGLSLRGLAKRIGMSAHSGLVDYERGVRVLPEDLAVACERALGLPAGHLVSLRRRALAERVARKLGPSGRPGGSAGRPGSPSGRPGGPADRLDEPPLTRISQAGAREAPPPDGWTEDLAAIAEGIRQIAGIMFSMNDRMARTAAVHDLDRG